jgi:hypothetical protein
LTVRERIDELRSLPGTHHKYTDPQSFSLHVGPGRDRDARGEARRKTCLGVHDVVEHFFFVVIGLIVPRGRNASIPHLHDVRIGLLFAGILNSDDPRVIVRFGTSGSDISTRIEQEILDAVGA